MLYLNYNTAFIHALYKTKRGQSGKTILIPCNIKDCYIKPPQIFLKTSIFNSRILKSGIDASRVLYSIFICKPILGLRACPQHCIETSFSLFLPQKSRV